MKEIITVDHTKDLNILSYSIDFEKGLLDAVKLNFPKPRAVGCIIIIAKIYI